MPHHHNHDHDDCASSTDVDNANEKGIEYSLYSKIDMLNLECLNEEIDGSGALVFKSYEDRLDFNKVINFF